ncbi:hypothetical protein [Streptomyces formicae]
MTTTPTLEELRKKAEKSQATADEHRAALLTAAVADAITSTKFGHLSAVARRAGISSQYLRALVEEDHPGWLAQAAEERAKEKAAGGKRASSKAA